MVRRLLVCGFLLVGGSAGAALSPAPPAALSSAVGAPQLVAETDPFAGAFAIAGAVRGPLADSFALQLRERPPAGAVPAFSLANASPALVDVASRRPAFEAPMLAFSQVSSSGGSARRMRHGVWAIDPEIPGLLDLEFETGFDRDGWEENPAYSIPEPRSALLALEGAGLVGVMLWLRRSAAGPKGHRAVFSMP